MSRGYDFRSAHRPTSDSVGSASRQPAGTTRIQGALHRKLQIRRSSLSKRTCRLEASRTDVAQNPSMPHYVRSVRLEHLSIAHIEYWDRCISVNHELTPFHSHRWLASWASAYRAKRRSLVWMSEDKAGSPLALLPLMRWRDTLKRRNYLVYSFIRVHSQPDPRLSWRRAER